MVNMKNINDNIISNRWEKRYEKLPGEIKEKLAELDNTDVSKYQLQVIKRKRIYPQIGDVFILKPKEDITLQGIVVNNHINNMNGDDLVLIMIFKPDVSLEQSINEGIKFDDLIITPVIVGKEYWTRGYFYNVGNNENIREVEDYGFYSIGKGKFLDEYGNELVGEPRLLGTYGVATIYGIAIEINEELIIAGII